MATWKRVKKRLQIGLAVPVLAFLLSLPTLVLASGGMVQDLPRLTNGGYLVDHPAQPIARNSTTPFIPASTIKLLTCLASLERLGPDFHFHTEIYLDDQNNLYIKGSGDPLLTSERIEEIAVSLFQIGITQYNRLILDNSLFSLVPADWKGNTPNPYDAPNGALVVNFNAVPVRLHPSGEIDSGEVQTPVIPLMERAAAILSAPGLYRINVASLDDKAQSAHLPPPLRYAGELFDAILRTHSIRRTGPITTGRVSPSCRLILRYRNPIPLHEIVRSCLEYSSNVIANQLFLVLGLQRGGGQASWESARAELRAFALENLRLPPTQFQIVEGSGLSRKNRLSPQALCLILRRFSPYRSLMPVHNGILLKSGTLEGVYSYAGYFRVASDNASRFVPFAILLNQKTNSRDTLLRSLAQLARTLPYETTEQPGR